MPAQNFQSLKTEALHNATISQSREGQFLALCTLFFASHGGQPL